ncbi:FAD binding domain protein [Candidatus Desulfosporosinus infrequens]|uniref:FAD binding domain protein n=1 Tax=Candidatus Desulfosporosinus infrequens TaxID=2043169 RepID=A0A2U3KVE2_9FIRM|nr:FAD binding domain protein [Candidatus Desulfosporosinus infrequens]
MPDVRRAPLSGWGLYPVEDCFIYRPERVQDLVRILSSDQQSSYIPRGLGRSYGDTAQNKGAGVLLNELFNHFLSFDSSNGILECEAGVSLAEINQYLVPKGFFLPVTPGTKFVTVGGAIANDIHGKNHHKDGCFSEHVLDFHLLLADGSIQKCSRDENREIFRATIGGIGLTGFILSARIRMQRVETGYIVVDYRKARNLDEALKLFSEGDNKYQHSVAWIDCLANGGSLGRSVLMRGNHAMRSELPKDIRDPLRIPDKRKLNVPFAFPSMVLNQLSIALFNKVYYASFTDNTHKIVDYDSFFYPLDAVQNWNRIYGKKGFVQYQVVLPPETSREGLVSLLEKLSKSRRSSFLAVLKSSGSANEGLLSFPYTGHTLALDLPIKDQAVFPFLRELDDIVIKYGGRVYLAKDSEISPELFRQMYPKLNQFQELRQKLDPNQIFSSSMSRRLGITEGTL